MIETFVSEVLRAIVFTCAAFNFFILVFFYERDGGSRRKLVYSVAALLIAAGQAYLGLASFRGVDIDWPVALSQVGLTTVLAAALGSTKKVGVFLIDHCGGCNALRKRD